MSSKRYSADWSNTQYQPHAGYAYNSNTAAPRPVNVPPPMSQVPQAQAEAVSPQAAYPAQSNGSGMGSQHRRTKSGGYPMYPPGWDKGLNTKVQPAPQQQASTIAPATSGRSGSTKTYSARAQAQPGVETQIQRPQARRSKYDDPTSPILNSPTDQGGQSRDSAQGRRKDSVPDRSPLQKLEVTLDDISKEEKRARVAEAEAQAQDRLMRDPKRSSTRRSGDGHQRRVSVDTPSDRDAQPRRATSGKRVVSAPIGGVPAAEDEEVYSAPRRVAAGATGTSAHPVDQRQYDRQSGYDQSYGPGSSNARAVPTSRTTEPNASAVQGDMSAARSNSKRLQKADPADIGRSGSTRTGKDELHATRTGGLTSDRSAAKKYQDPDPLPPNAVLNQQMPGPEGPKYQIPPQTAAAQNAHDRVIAGGMQLVPAITNMPPQGRFHGVFHRGGPERRYQQFSRPLDEWRSAQTAVLMGDDLVLEDTTDKSSAWWEKNDQQRRRSSSARASTQLSSPIDADDSRPTYFQPPLYLKCGPLLRYCGVAQNQSARGSVREMWRGSVLIVTDDTNSQTQQAPVLRLFVEPRDLLPPPPAELNVEGGQQLAPEYVDPLAGQIHMSRIGKTLYVRPVEQLEEGVDLSRVENDTGLFEEKRSGTSYAGGVPNGQGGQNGHAQPRRRIDGEKLGKYREVKAFRLHQERNTTFWRFNIEVELGFQQARIAYRVNNGPALGFWVPARGESMNTMFHSCNGFSLSVKSDEFCGPDPLWRDVLNAHQTRPFHVMIGGGDQIYNDAATTQTELFREWCESRNPQFKHSAQFTVEMQEELETFYCERYAMWFSQGLFGMANGQIPMVNVWDDHDLIDGFGSYPHANMSTPVFTGIGAVAYKYYMLFQHQTISAETEQEEPSWLLGASPGPYIREQSRSLFMFLGGGKKTAFLGLDCRMERMKDEILSQETYDRVFDRLQHEIEKGVTRHLIVLLGVPIAYPRLNFLENVLTSRAMDPVKALGRLGLFGNLLNKFDGGVEILDDLDDHWTAKHHKHERNWFIQELQEVAAEKSVRVTILGGDVHLAAVGQFYSNKKLGIPKDKDHRYMPNIVCSAIVNTPPPELMADVLNKRNKIHHLDHDTDEDMIPLFTHDVDGKPRNNHRLLPRRNWCSIREYQPGSTPPPTPPMSPSDGRPPSRRGSLNLIRSLSFSRNDSKRLQRRDTASARPPRSFFNAPGNDGRRASDSSFGQPGSDSRRTSMSRPQNGHSGYFAGVPPASESDPQVRPNVFHRVPTGLSERAALRGAGADEVDISHHINLQHGLDIVLNLEVNQHDPAGITTPYRLLVPALNYTGQPDINPGPKPVGLLRGLSQRFRNRRGSSAKHAGYGSEFSSQGDVVHSYPMPPLPSQPPQMQQQMQHGRQPSVSYGPAGAIPNSHNIAAPRQSGQYARHDDYVDTPPAAAAAVARGAPQAPFSGNSPYVAPDGRMAQQDRFRGDGYGGTAAQPGAQYADHNQQQYDDDDYSEADEELPRPGLRDRVRHGLGLGHGA